MKKNFFPAYIFGLLIIIFSSLPPSQLGKIKESYHLFHFLFSDFILHFTAFGFLAVLLYLGYSKLQNPSIPYFKIGAYSVAYGLFIEVYQLLFPYRSFALNDLAADFLGIGFSLAVIGIVIEKH